MIKQKVKRLIEYPVALIFGAVVIGFLVCYFMCPDTDFSGQENRYLEARPSFAFDAVTDGTFMQSFEDYTADQIPGREFLIKSKAVLETCILKCENNGVLRGQDGYLFEKNVSTSPQFYKNIAAINNFSQILNRDIYVAIAPTSSYIYRGKLPYAAPVLDEKLMYDEMLREIQQDNVHMVNLYDEMENHANEQLYYRTDHHWTSDGAYYAYLELSKAMDFKAENPSVYSKHVVNDFYGTYYAKYKGVGIEPDKIEYYDIPIEYMLYDDNKYESLYDESKASEYDKYGLFLRGNTGLISIKTKADDGKKIVVIKDSYANCLVPFLAMSYDNIAVVDTRYYGASVVDLLEEYEDADVLLLYNMSHMNEDNHFYKLIR